MPIPAGVPSVLIADDQPDVLQALRLLLKGEGFAVETTGSPGGVLSALERGDFDVLLMDLNYTRDTTSGREGFDLLTRIQLLDGSLPVVVMTAYGSVEGAVEAMRRGARDYLEKPWDNTRLVSLLRTQVELGRALRQSQRLESENQTLRREGLPELVADSPAMRQVARLMERVAPSDANALILGEHGVGKEIAARWLHAASARAARPMITVNVGGLSEGVFESELFGHLKGAFTDAKSDRMGRFELADDGTLFLDEIANITPSQQAKLLRVLNTGELERVGSSKTRTVRCPGPLRDQRRSAGRSAGRPLPGGSALPAQHGRDPHSPTARPARGSRPARGAVPSPPCYPLPQGRERIPPRGDGGPVALRLARECAGAGPHHRTGRAADGRDRDPGC